MGEESNATPRPVISDEEAAALLEPAEATGVRPFDMTLRRINRTRLPNLEHIAKTFAGRASASLSAMLGREVSLAFERLDRGKSADLMAALPNPASVVAVRIKPLPELALLNFEPAILLALLDAFFGGNGRASADPLAAASTAAQRFLGVLTRNLSADFNAAWALVAPVELEAVKQESNPRFIQTGTAPTEAMIVVRFLIGFGECSGAHEWLLPEALLAPLREALLSEGEMKKEKPHQSWAPALGAILQSAQIETRAVLGEAQISLRTLVQLAPGDVIPFEAPETATLLAQDVPLYRGRFGISQGKNALKILGGAES